MHRKYRRCKEAGQRPEKLPPGKSEEGQEWAVAGEAEVSPGSVVTGVTLHKELQEVEDQKQT